MNNFLSSFARFMFGIARTTLFINNVFAWWRFWPELIRGNRLTRLFFYASYRRQVRKQFDRVFRAARQNAPGISREIVKDIVGDALLLPQRPQRFRCGHIVPKWMTRSAYHAVVTDVLRPKEWCAKCGEAPPLVWSASIFSIPEAESVIDSARASCIYVESPNLLPGWICCKCKIYNDVSRIVCKHCAHERCGGLE